MPIPILIAGINSMTVPPNALAAFSIWGTVYLSSKYKLRAPFIIGAAVVAIIGT